MGVPIGLVNQPEGPVFLALAKAQASEPGLNAGQAVGVERLRLLRKLLQPLVFRRRRRRLRFRLRRLAEKRREEGRCSEGEREGMGKGKKKGFGEERELLGR